MPINFSRGRQGVGEMSPVGNLDGICPIDPTPLGVEHYRAAWKRIAGETDAHDLADALGIPQEVRA